jgi:hypothetical protein
VKDWKDVSHESTQCAALGFVSSSAEVKAGAAVLKAVAAKQAKERAGA